MSLDEIFSGIKLISKEAATEEATRAVFIPSDDLLAVVDYLKNKGPAFEGLHCLTAIDRKDKIEMVYIFYSFRMRRMLTLKINLGLEDLRVKSLSGFFSSADWFEREVYDLFGIQFLNHPCLRRILNPDSWALFPLRKDFCRPDFITKPQY